MDTETLLREALSGRAEALGVPGDDPWPSFARRERTHRRNRRIRLVSAAVVLAAAVGVQSGVVPLPGWAPGIAIAGRQTALTSAPTRGSLAGDTAWLEGMRGAIKDVEDPGELWKVADRKKIKFVYAGDVAGRRLMLAAVPLRFGFLTDQALIWYEGAAGAAPAAMTESGREDGGQTVTTFMEGRAEGAGCLVVVAPPGTRVAVSVGFDYSAAGRIVHHAPTMFAGGVAEMTLPRAPFNPGVTVTVTEGDRTVYAGPAFGSWGSEGSEGGDPQEPTGAMLDQALAGRAFDRETMRVWLGGALHDAQLVAAGTTARVRWTGTVNGQPAALVTLQHDGGGVLAYAWHGSSSSYRQDLRLLLPAAGVESRPIAWRMRAEGKDDRTGQVIVVVPPGTARATLTVGGGQPVTLALDAAGEAVTTLAPDAAATVTAYPADGSAPSSTPVTPFETDSSGLPGDTMKTRVVP
jgi:hypothetical protein